MRARAPWAVWLFTIIGLVGCLVIGTNADRPDGEIEPVILFAVFVMVLGFATVGALIVSRHPSNPVGWICGAVAVIYVSAGLADSSVTSYPERVQDAGPAVRLLIAIGESLWAVGLGLGATLLLLLFPDGRLPSRRWRPIAWAASAFLIVIPLALILTPGRIQGYPVQNPVGIPGAASVLEGIVGLTFLGLMFTVPLCISSLFFRYRSAGPLQRQQLKWLLFATSLVGVLFSTAVVIDVIGNQSDASGELSNFLSTAGISFIPIGIGVAVLKHRLYDIDVIINRALVYTGLTAVLALTYVTIVFGLQQILSPITEQSDLAIAASTLAVAALFRPMRSRLQGFIDHRFYRRKFDAQRTLDEFSSTLRDEVDLSALSSRLTGVVTDTMQPRHVSLWLRGKQSA